MLLVSAQISFSLRRCEMLAIRWGEYSVLTTVKRLLEDILCRHLSLLASRGGFILLLILRRRERFLEFKLPHLVILLLVLGFQLLDFHLVQFDLFLKLISLFLILPLGLCHVICECLALSLEFCDLLA